jgi:hypothetical protein
MLAGIADNILPIGSFAGRRLSAFSCLFDKIIISSSYI